MSKLYLFVNEEYNMKYIFNELLDQEVAQLKLNELEKLENFQEVEELRQFNLHLDYLEES